METISLVKGTTTDPPYLDVSASASARQSAPDHHPLPLDAVHERSVSCQPISGEIQLVGSVAMGARGPVWVWHESCRMTVNVKLLDKKCLYRVWLFGEARSVFCCL